MVQVNIHDAKTNLSRLLERMANGEDIIIARAGKPVARLIPFTPERKRRVLGQAAGQVWMAPDFDVLPADVQVAFEGEDL